MELHTDRLLLRPFTEDDLEVLHSWHANPEVTRYLLSDVEDRAGSQARLKRRIEQAVPPTVAGEAISFAVQRDGLLIGDVQLELVSTEHRRGEIGYILDPQCAGNGYATEAAGELLRLGFEDMTLHRIIGCCDARNVGSEAVLRRIGMRREALFTDNEFVKGAWSSEAVWAILRREWRER